MNTDFRFDLDSDVDLAENQSQPPWELSGYSQAVADEHLQRRTTSVDHKISQARLKRRPVGKGAPHGENGREEDEQPTHARKKGGRKGLGAQKRRGGSSLPGRDDAEEEDEDADDQSGSGSDDALEEDLQIPEAGQWADDSDSNGDEDPKDDLPKVGHFEDVEDGGETEEEDDDDSEDGESGLEEEEYGKKVISADTTKPEKASRNIRMPFQDAKIQDDGKNDKKVPEFFSSAEGTTFSARNFVELNISRPLVRACEALGYKQPTPIQAACIPLALTGRDICGSAVTGSGKTAAFALPLLERLLFRPRRIHAIRVLILTPTRELAVQVHSMIEKLAQFTDIRCCLVVGGLSIKAQEVALRAHPDIVVATPGRMIDHLHNTQSVGLEDLSILILDEADRLLELGFSQEVHELVRLCPKRRQTMLFSATMTEEVDELIKLSLTNPVRLSADPSTQRPSTLLEEVIKVRPQHEADKEAVLLAICSRSFTSKTIIFSGTKVEAHRLKILFGLSGLTAAELHGNLTQTQRLQALELFRKNEVDFLVATDVAARGLDIIGVETVVNFECPHDITTYVHRVGRTARAGQRGCAVTFVTDKDRSLLKSVAKRAGSKLQNRVVASAAITMWREKIEEMEDDIHGIMREEKEERALRKAEMEANKAQNLMEHEAEIFARPKKTWFQTPKEKRLIAKSAKAAKDGTENDGNARKVLSVEEAEDLRKKEKRRLEQEKNMTRKKRRRLEAAREVAEEDNQENDEQIDDRLLEKRSGKKALKKEGSSVVDLAYRRAKSAKAAEKARLSGKTMHRRKDADKMRSKSSRSKNRREEMQELFQGDLGEAKRHKGLFGKGFSVTAKRRKPSVSKKSFKSKSRYKRR